jgi:hypothetical protein
MVSAGEVKSVAAGANALSDADILQHVFTFLPGNWLYLGAVCSEWSAAYAGIADQQVWRTLLNGSSELVTCGTKTTLFSAVIASPVRVRLARDAGLAVSQNDQLQVIAGLHADMKTLVALRDMGMPLSYTVIKAVALAGRLSIMQQIFSEQLCARPDAPFSYGDQRRPRIIDNYLSSPEYQWADDNTCAAGATAAAAVPAAAAAAAETDAEGQLQAPSPTETDKEWREKPITCTAASNGGVKCENWVQRSALGLQHEAIVMAIAASAGHTAVCEYLRSLGCAWNDAACDRAAERGQFDTLRWLREHGCPWYVSTVCINAACYGSTDILDYVVQQGEVLDADVLADTLMFADTCNQQQVVKWLRGHGAQ